MEVRNKETREKVEKTPMDYMEEAIEAVEHYDLVRLGKRKSDSQVEQLKASAINKINLYNNLVGIKGLLTIGKSRDAIVAFRKRSK